MRKKRVNPRNRIRYERNWRRAYGSDERVEFVKRLPCVAGGSCRGEIENAHVKGGGIGRKSDACHVVALCALHHRELHDNGIEWFERYYMIDLDYCADLTEQLWRRFCGEEVA